MKSFENLRAMIDAQQQRTQQSIDNFNKSVPWKEPAPVGSVTVHAVKPPIPRRRL